MTANRCTQQNPENAELRDGTSTVSNRDPKPEADQSSPELRSLFPNLTEDQLREVAETLHGYCAIVWRIYERLGREHPEIIDELMLNRNIKRKVDSSK